MEAPCADCSARGQHHQIPGGFPQSKPTPSNSSQPPKCHTLPKTQLWQIFVELMWTELFRNSYFAIFCRATNRQQTWICDFKKTFPFLHKLETLLGCSWSQTVDKQHPYLLHFWCKRRNTKSKGKYIRSRFFSLQIWYSFWKQLLNRY